MTDTCEYAVLAVDGSSKTATVKFTNPYYSGKYITVTTDASGTPTTTDTDPNPHATKTIRVPFKDDGSIDTDSLKEILDSQALGVRARMDATYEKQAASGTDLSGLIGLTNTTIS